MDGVEEEMVVKTGGGEDVHLLIFQRFYFRSPFGRCRRPIHGHRRLHSSKRTR